MSVVWRVARRTWSHEERRYETNVEYLMSIGNWRESERNVSEARRTRGAMRRRGSRRNKELGETRQLTRRATMRVDGVRRVR